MAALTILNADKSDEESITIRQNKYLNNLVEQDHRNIKRRIRLASTWTGALAQHRADTDDTQSNINTRIK